MKGEKIRFRSMKIKSHFQKGIRYVVFLSSCMLSIFPMHGEERPFVRVRSLQELTWSDSCIIVSSVDTTKALKAEPNGTGTKIKMQSAVVRYGGNVLYAEDALLLWKITSSSKGYTLSNLAGTKYLKGASGSADFTFSSGVGKDDYWQISLSQENDSIYNSTERKKLAYSGSDDYWGFYTRSWDVGSVRIYRPFREGVDVATDSITPPGGVTDPDSSETTENLYRSDFIPADTVPFLLTADIDGVSYALQSRQPMRISIVTDSLLEDSTFAIQDKFFRFYFSLRADSSINLRDYDNVDYYCADLSKISREPENCWFWRQGSLYVYDGTNVKQFVVEKSSKTPRLILVQNFSEALYSPIQIGRFSASPTSVLDGNGLLKIYGGWNVSLLKKVLTENILSLDLEDAVLPLQATDFTYSAPSNVIIYLRESSLPHIPLSWQNIVKVDESGERSAVTDIVFTDRKPFFVAYSFDLEEREARYSRQLPTDGRWNSFYLPFSMHIPEDVRASRKQDVQSDQILLHEIDSAEPYDPFFCRFVGEEMAATREIVFTAGSTHVQNTPDVESGAIDEVIGVHRKMTVDQENSSIFLLSNDGRNFVRAAIGSTLDPFRCYLLCASGSVASKILKSENTVGISNPSWIESIDDPQLLFSPDGYFLGKVRRSEISRRHLPCGIYLLGKEKIIVR